MLLDGVTASTVLVFKYKLKFAACCTLLFNIALTVEEARLRKEKNFMACGLISCSQCESCRQKTLNHVSLGRCPLRNIRFVNVLHLCSWLIHPEVSMTYGLLIVK